MKKLILAGACAAFLAMPAAAQTVTPGDIINTVKNVWDATHMNQFTGWHNGVYYQNGVPVQNGYNSSVPVQNGYYNHYQVPATPAYNYSLNSPLDVVFTNLAQGSVVGSNFVLDGYTSPYNQVDLSIRTQGRGPRYRSTAVADSAGHFAVNVDATQVPYNQSLTIRARAHDSSGRQGQARTLHVVRR